MKMGYSDVTQPTSRLFFGRYHKPVVEIDAEDLQAPLIVARLFKKST
jgi:hypothetical protein